MLNRGDDALKLEGVKQVWGRDGLLAPNHSNEAAVLYPVNRRIDHKQVALQPFCFFDDSAQIVM